MKMVRLNNDKQGEAKGDDVKPLKITNLKIFYLRGDDINVICLTV